MALASNGTVWAWGDNDFGELGNGTNTSSNIPVQVSLPSGVTITNIAGGVSGHSLALASNGTVWAWGYGVNGELGNGTNTVSNIPVQVSLPNGVTITNIVGGAYHSLALASNGTVWAWGYNNFGQLGNGTNTSSNIPVQVSLPSGVTITNIAGGAYHILTLGIIVGSTTATTLTSSANPSNHGQSVTFTATINPVPDGGTVQFQDNGVNINPQINIDSSGQAICTTSTLSIGTHTITAVYTGDTNFASSTGTLTQTVNPSPILKISADDDVSSILQSAANDFYNDTGIVLDITIKSDSQAIQDLNNGNCDIAGVGTISGN